MVTVRAIADVLIMLACGPCGELEASRSVRCGAQCATVANHAYTHLKGPIAWMAPETFDEGEKGQLVSPASDVYMLGSCFVEVATGCERQPFDWLTPSSAFVFRGHETTRAINCLQVGGV